MRRMVLYLEYDDDRLGVLSMDFIESLLHSSFFVDKGLLELLSYADSVNLRVNDVMRRRNNGY